VKAPQCTQASCRPSGRIVRFGFFRRREDGRRIQRFRCQTCRRTFSTATFQPTYRQKKRRINATIERLLTRKMNLSHIATFLRVAKTTVTRKLIFLGRARWAEFASGAGTPRQLLHVQFDEMQTSVHTKCKPVSIPMAVDAKTYKVVAFDVCSMPAQHPLVEISLRKYGPRKDERPEAIARVLAQVAPMIGRGGTVTTDMAPRYPGPIARIIPHAQHLAHRSRKARRAGQGELKKIGRDPLFPFNHTAAMMRDHASRLVRQTWSNTKKVEHLRYHLAIVAHGYNRYRDEHPVKAARP